MARLEALNNIIIPGIGYVTRGDVFDLPDDKIDARIQRACVNADGSRITIEVRTLESLTLADLKTKAQAMGVSFGPRTSKAQLIERIEEMEAIPTTIV